ncbi:MAG: DUF2007 domain-containing protein [Pseudomonadota bacterium]
MAPSARAYGRLGYVARKLHTADNLMTIVHLKNILEGEGIRCTIRNQFLSGALGEIPAFECWPQLWVTQPSDWLRARGLLSEFLAQPDGEEASWQCAQCGEHIDGQFAECWQCGAACPSEPLETALRPAR